MMGKALRWCMSPEIFLRGAITIGSEVMSREKAIRSNFQNARS
jgi:hypothetical protein